MIKGIGTDIVETVRIEKMLKEHGKAFTSKIFTEAELDESKKRGNASHYFAGRWAAKEAASKALGCGFGAKCGWQDIEILNNIDGKPEIKFHGVALNTAKELDVAHLHVSISHEQNYACANVVIE